MTKVIKKTVVTILLLCTALSFASFAACGVKFKVNFIVDGTVYSAIDTSGAEVIEMPQNPTKDGYTFDGWYWDKDTWQKPFTANSLLEAPLSSDMNVYCKWKANVINVESVSLSETEITMHVDEEKTLTATILPADATDTSVVWESSNSTVATVVGGKITALSVGTTTITATTTDGGKIATCSVEVVEDKITFNTLTVDGDNVYGVVSNSTTRFSFLNEIEEQGDAEYAVYREITCEIEVASKTIALNVGDNTVYVLQSVGKALKQYAVTIRRRPMYTVTFNTNGGTEVESQTIEESFCATEPTTERTGYTFDKWNYDYSNPIMKDTVISAEWVAIPYNISYKLNGGTNSNQNPSMYTIEQKVTLSEPTRLGYIFTGWSNSGVIEKGNTGEKTFTASWVEAVYRRSSVITGCRSDVKDLVILKEYNGIEITSIEEEAFKNNTSLVSVTIPDSVTSMHDDAFYGCSSLNKVNYTGTIGKNVKKIPAYLFYPYSHSPKITEVIFEKDSVCKSIGKYAFIYCSSLKSITIPNSVTSIGKYAFYNCSSLTSIEIPDSVTSIGSSAFSGCNSLEEMIIPFVGATAGVTSSDKQYPFGYIFGERSYTGGTATKQYYHDGSTSSKTNTTYYIPSSLKKVTVTGGNILYGAFYNCKGLTSVTIGNGVTSIGNSAFYYCSSLTCVTIGNSVTSIGNSAFYYCDSLTSVTLGESVTSIGEYAFCYCSLTSVYYEGTAEQWANISIDLYNSNLTYATRYYYSETEPTDGDNYWHYDENGNITVW